MVKSKLFDETKHRIKRAKIFEGLLNDRHLGKFCINYNDFPEPFQKCCKSVKAIILGADPTNPRKDHLKVVFGLEKLQSPYFSSIFKNLQKLGLGLDDIYVQNLCPNYFSQVTDENPKYEEIAGKYWLPFLKDELDAQFPCEVPVLITAWKPFVVIAPEAKAVANKKSRIYTESIVFSKNNLCRPVFAFFRGGYRKGFNGYYDIDLQEYSDYKKLIISYFHKN